MVKQCIAEGSVGGNINEKKLRFFYFYERVFLFVNKIMLKYIFAKCVIIL